MMRRNSCAYNAHKEKGAMKTAYKIGARKRPVNLTLNEDLLAQARGLTSNLSNVVETLLADYVQQERKQRAAKLKALQATSATWNAFNAKFGSFADEHSTL